MPNAITKFQLPFSKRILFSVLPLFGLYGLLWIFSDRFIDGPTILISLGVITITNTLLFMGIQARLPALARLYLFASYAFVVLSIILLAFQLRNS